MCPGTPDLAVDLDLYADGDDRTQEYPMPHDPMPINCSRVDGFCAHPLCGVCAQTLPELTHAWSPLPAGRLP